MGTKLSPPSREKRFRPVNLTCKNSSKATALFTSRYRSRRTSLVKEGFSPSMSFQIYSWISGEQFNVSTAMLRQYFSFNT
ncbi:Uncharacterised protein [Chlamydia trachomatis]|nr:Uncharacterised protein [Chlamydia trachomatis]